MLKPNANVLIQVGIYEKKTDVFIICPNMRYASSGNKRELKYV